MRSIARICLHFKANTEEWVWKATGERLQGPCYLISDYYDRKIRARKQRIDIGKYSLVNKTIKHWDQPPAEALLTSPCKSNLFKLGVRRVIISEGI
jgi:hypothetical protein